MTDQVTAGAAVETASEPATAAAAATAPGARPPRKKERLTPDQRARMRDSRPAIDLGIQRPGDQGRKGADGESPSNRQIARDNMLNFKPIASHPADLHTVTLVTEYTQKLYFDHCGRAQISLYNLMHYLPIRMRILGLHDERGEDFLDKLEERLDARIEDIATRMKADLARAKTVLANNQLTAVATYSQPPKDCSLAKYTPQIVRLLSLLVLFDQYIAAIDGLYTNGYLRRRGRAEAINKYRNEIATMIRFFMRLYNDSKELLKQGESARLEHLLVERDENELPDRLDEAEEAEARRLTGAAEHEAELAAAAAA